MPGRLRIQRPSPTTVSFTVSNAPQRSNPSAKILFSFQILLRAILFGCVIFVAAARLRHFALTRNGPIFPWQDVWSSPFAAKMCDLVDTYNPWAIIVVSAAVIYAVFRRGYTGMEP